MMKTMESQNGELKREVAEGESAFGYDKSELLSKLKTDEEFRQVFMSQFVVVQGLVKEFNDYEKESKALLYWIKALVETSVFNAVPTRNRATWASNSWSRSGKRTRL